MRFLGLSIWILVATVQAQQPSVYGPITKFAATSGAGPNFLDGLSGIEHHFSFTDLTTNAAVGIEHWVDRILGGAQDLFWYSADSRPTNTSLGLVFFGNASLTNTIKNINGGGGNDRYSLNDGVNGRLFFFIYSTANAVNQNLMSQNTATRGVVLNSNGSSGNTAGTAYITDSGSFTTQYQIATANSLKTDGTLICLCFGNTNHPSPSNTQPFGGNGYTNGYFCTGFSPTPTGQGLNCVGEGFHLLNAKLWDFGTFTNTSADCTAFFATCASNVNYFRTNFYKVAQ